MFFHWVRLTPAASSPLAAKQTITWTGSGAATITVRDNSDGAVFPVVSNLSANSYLWNYGVLAPGSYTLTVTNSSGSGSAIFTINNPPSIEVTDPSPTSGDDYATTVLGNAWDMNSAADIQLTGTRPPHEPVVQRRRHARHQHEQRSDRHTALQHEQLRAD